MKATPDTPPKVTLQGWLDEGSGDYDNWRFVCPICGNTAAVGDYRPFKDKDKDASPDSAARECIGMLKPVQVQ